jgi:hypothetical protein
VEAGRTLPALRCGVWIRRGVVGAVLGVVGTVAAHAGALADDAAHLPIRSGATALLVGGVVGEGGFAEAVARGGLVSAGRESVSDALRPVDRGEVALGALVRLTRCYVSCAKRDVSPDPALPG